MLNILDLFSGIGGFSLGLERTGGFKTVGFCEVDPKAQAVLKKHWPQVPIYNDVSKLKGEDLNGTIDIITGGFPCQDISLAGKGAGLEGERSGLWWEFHRLIKEIQPKWVIAENVAALRSRGLDQVLRSLSEIGYDAEWHCIPAAAVGAPHRRDRVWIVAYPQLHGLSAPQISRSIEETIRQESSGKDNTLHVEGTSGIPAPNEDVAYSNVYDRRNGGGTKSSEREARVELRGSSERQLESRPSEDVAHSSIKGSQGGIHRRENQERQAELGHLGCSSAMDRQPIKDFWSVEPNVGRVAHGVPKRVDRLKQLGNAVVPQIPELIGRAILNLTH